MSTSYSNPGGTGDRRRMMNVTVSGGIGVGGGTPRRLVNGITGTNEFFLSGGSAGDYVQFDFFDDQYVIDEARFIQSSTGTHGTQKWRGSNDGSTWTDIGSSFTVGGATTQTQTQLSSNTTAYSKYRLELVSGSWNGGPWIYEMEFKISELSGPRINGCTYDDPLGSGDRTATVAVSIGGGLSMNLANPLTSLVNGLYANASYINADTATGNWVKFDLGTGKLVDEISVLYTGTDYGLWKWQGSNDDSSWTDLGTGFELVNVSLPDFLVDRSFHANSTAYRYYRALCVTGGPHVPPYDGNWMEVEFRAGAAFVSMAASGSIEIPAPSISGTARMIPPPAPGSGGLSIPGPSISGTARMIAAVQASCNNPPQGHIGVPYTHSIAASGPTGSTLIYAIVGGALPPGLSLDEFTGQINGVPIISGAFSFAVKVRAV